MRPVRLTGAPRPAGRFRLLAPRDAAGVAAGVAVVLTASQVMNLTGLVDGVTVAVTALVLMGLGLLVGGGVTCLCQLSFAAIGAYVVSQLSLWNFPGTLAVWIAIGGLGAGLAGLVIGLMALRVRGVRLAILTLAFAALVDSVFSVAGFPGAASLISVARPAYLLSNQQYFIFAGLICVAGALAAVVFSRSRTGLALRCMRSSERATAAIGCGTAGTKLLAFAFAAVLAGVAGGIEAGQSGISVESAFSPMQSLSLLALAVMIGVEYAGGAVIGGLVFTVIPNVLGDMGVSPSYALMLFGVGAIPALRSETTPGEQFRMKARARLTAYANRRRHASQVAAAPDGGLPTATARAAPAAVSPERENRQPSPGALEVTDLEVRFGAVRALDGICLTVRPGEFVGLIGPNGAGKSTLVDVVTGFLDPDCGSVRVSGACLDGLPPHLRARAGLRRTFQQDRMPSGLRVEEYLRLAAGTAVTGAEVSTAIEFVGGPPADAAIGLLDAGSRRLVEVAAGLLARPDVLVLDEPTAGLGLDARTRLATHLPVAMWHYGTSVLLIEHDLDMIRTACDRVYVLDYGRLIAEGPPAEVLRSDAVSRAYFGGQVVQ